MLAGLLLSLVLANAAVTGIVKDSTGGAVPGAAVIVRSESGAEQQTVTGPDGRFTFDQAPDTGTLIVRAGGFAEKRQPISGGSLDIVLSPATLLETVTVTPTRTEQRLGTIPASVSVLTAEQIQESPALVADDVLRRIPTFSLFRRTSSLSSHPTAQGVSLRGVGPSGVSRTLVLLDGVPFNDPFGGWVYWTRVPMESADRIETVSRQVIQTDDNIEATVTFEHQARFPPAQAGGHRSDSPPQTGRPGVRGCRQTAASNSSAPVRKPRPSPFQSIFCRC